MLVKVDTKRKYIILFFCLRGKYVEFKNLVFNERTKYYKRLLLKFEIDPKLEMIFVETEIIFSSGLSRNIS